MVSALVWRLLAVVRFWRVGAPVAARNSRLNRRMRPKLGRLKRRAEFLRAASAGRKAATTGLVLQAVPSADAPGADAAGLRKISRVGFTASRKVGNAVARNRTKRRLRALARAILPDRAEIGFDYVLIARQATLSRSFTQMQTDLVYALGRVGTLRADTQDHPE